QRYPHRGERCPGAGTRQHLRHEQGRGRRRCRPAYGRAQTPLARGRGMTRAQKRSAARLAAVQALYQMDLTGTGVVEVLAEFEAHWIGQEIEGVEYTPAEAAFFRDIVGGVVREQRVVDPK